MDYELIDSGAGRRLERFGKYVLNRPDPEVMWSKNLEELEWDKADAKFIDDKWITKSNFPEKWELEVNDLIVNLKLTPFKHVGIFPEQLPQWNLIQKLIANSQKQLNVLNLFG
jgi:23S rRNA (cytosine1962-C5)-methyltransferase